MSSLERMWGFDHPLSQFDLPANVLYNIQEWADDYEVVDLASMTAADLGNLIHMNERLGGNRPESGEAISPFCHQIPSSAPCA